MKSFHDTHTHEEARTDFPEIRLPRHELLAKQALFARISEEKTSGLKGFFSMLAHSKTLVGFISGAALTLVLVGGAYTGRDNVALADYNPFASGEAKAKAAVKVGATKATRLSDEEVARVNAKIKADMKASLDEAMRAEDVTIVEGSSKAKGEAVVGVSGVPANKLLIVNGEAVAATNGSVKLAPAPAEVQKQVQYTDEQGNKVILGLDAAGIPVFKAVELSAEQKAQIDAKAKAGPASLPAHFESEGSAKGDTLIQLGN